MRARTLAALVSFPLLAACGGGAGSTASPEGSPSANLGPAPDPASYRASIDHPWFPASPGTTWTYRGEEDGVPFDETVRVLSEPRVLLGVSCLGLEEETSRDGVLLETTTEWYAQDESGAVWKFGEESFAAHGRALVATRDSWVAGEAGATPWLWLPAAPRVGDRCEGGPDGGRDLRVVRSLDATAAVPAGLFEGCLAVEENPDDPDDVDLILYATGVGAVSTTFPGGRIELVSRAGP
jgi:hypothetical protein